MLVEEIQFNLVLPQDGTRTPGLHLSDVIRDLAVKSGVLDAKWLQADLSPMMMMLGLAWEEWVSKQHSEVVFHPGEVIRDGILMSPDGVTLLGGELSIVRSDSRHGKTRVNEFKYTRKSSRGFDEALRKGSKKVWMWLVQIMSYALALDALEAFLHVLFANGDYNREDGEGNPEYRIYRLLFSRIELVRNWEMVVRHKERMKSYAGK